MTGWDKGRSRSLNVAALDPVQADHAIQILFAARGANMETERTPDPVAEGISRIAWRALFKVPVLRTQPERVALAKILISDAAALEIQGR